MTQVTTAAELQTQILPFTGQPEPIREVSQIPRAELRYVTKGQLIAAPGAGDNQAISYSCILPRNFSYVLIELYAGIFTSAVQTCNFESQAYATLFTDDAGTGAGSEYNLNLPVECNGEALTTGGTSGKIYTLKCPPKMTILPEPSNGQLLGWFINDTDNDTQYYFNFIARFLQYDVTQATHYQQNMPQLTR